MPRSDAFLLEFSKVVEPQLRGLGFKGSRRNFRRVQGEVVHILNVQGSSSGERCYVNLGVHLSFLPSAGTGTSDLKKLKEYDCAFRSRLDPQPHFSLGWPYGATPEQTERIVHLLSNAIELQAVPYFYTYFSFPESFQNITLAELDSGTTPCHAAHLFIGAQILKHAERFVESEVLSRTALQRTPERAVSLRREIIAFRVQS